MFEIVSMPVKATMPTGMAIRKSLTVGAVPKSTLSTRTSGENTRTKPRITSPTWVRKSRIARTTFSPAASLTPTTLTAPRITTTAMPQRMSPGAVSSGSQITPR
jgi:hypothetical protein